MIDPTDLFNSMRCIYLPKLHINGVRNVLGLEDDVDDIEDFLYFCNPNIRIFGKEIYGIVVRCQLKAENS